MKTQNYLALDFGAGSGRGIVGAFDGMHLKTEEIYRFDHFLNVVNGKTYWNILELNRQMKNIFKKAVADGIPLAGAGIDTWALDYGLLDKNGDLLGGVLSYRNAAEAVVKKTWEKISSRELFSITGVGHLVYNTVYQLFERKLREDVCLEHAKTLLLLPDLLTYFITGEKGAEYTDAMTTMLLDSKTGTWSQEILNRLGIQRDIFAEIEMPGSRRGVLTKEICAETGMSPVPVSVVASHDTAAAIAAIPAGKERFAYISSGTWSLFGTECEKPVITEKAFLAGYSNEGSLQGTFRLNKNIMGLGLLQECRRDWGRKERLLSWDEIVQAAAQAAPFQAFVDTDALEFFDLQNLAEKILHYCEKRGRRISSKGEIARCVYESLAMKYRFALEELEDITGERYEAIYIVGGGCRNNLLNQFTANATGLPVIAGPAEGASMANALTQAMAAGELYGVSELREVVCNSVETNVFYPMDKEEWTEQYQIFLKTTRSEKQ